MAKQPKRIKAWTGDRDATHALPDAIKLVKENAKAKFDESIEISVNLGVDPRHADQQVRGVVNLPSGTGRDVRVAVFAKDAKAAEALAAGAEHASRDTDRSGADDRADGDCARPTHGEHRTDGRRRENDHDRNGEAGAGPEVAIDQDGAAMVRVPEEALEIGPGVVRAPV